MTPTPLEQSILSVVTYFDLFSYPLTAWEIWKWCLVEPGREASFATVRLTLESSPYVQSRLEKNEGFYFLHGHDANVAIRKDRYLMAEKKYRRVLRAVRFFRCLPFIRAIAVCNSLALSNTRKDGDLDLLIITKPGRIWTSRMLTTGFAKMFGWRPTQDHAQDTVCLSFFLSENSLDLHSLLREPTDPYMWFWLDQLVPVYGDMAIFDRLRSENSWMQDHLPHSYGVQTARRRIVNDAWWSKTIRSILALFHSGAWGDVLEQRYRRVQENLLPPHLRELANKDSRVVLNDAMLKFHDNDRRDAIAAQFASRLAEVA